MISWGWKKNFTRHHLLDHIYLQLPNGGIGATTVIFHFELLTYFWYHFVTKYLEGMVKLKTIVVADDGISMYLSNGSFQSFWTQSSVGVGSAFLGEDYVGWKYFSLADKI